MSDDTTETTRESTRREYVKYGALLGGGLVAGCLGDETTPTDAPADTDTETSAESPTETPTPTTDAGSATESPTATASGPYTVEMAPMGDVTFESPPSGSTRGRPRRRAWPSRSDGPTTWTGSSRPTTTTRCGTSSPRVSPVSN